MAARAEIVLEEAELNDLAGTRASLWAGLERLDMLLARGIEAAQSLFGPGASADGFRGLYLNRADVDRLLERTPGEPLLRLPGDALTSPHPLGWLSRLLPGLGDFDFDVMLIALAPELDLRYERLYAYLQDDITRKRPTVDLALNLLCSNSEERLARRSHFDPDAPLVRHAVLELIADPSQVEPPLLASYFKLDEEIVSLLLGQNSLGRLSTFCQWLAPQPGDLDEHLAQLALQARADRRPLRLYFRGARGAGKRRAAQALAAAAAVPLLAAQLASPSFAADPRAPARLIRTARLRNAMLYLDGWDAMSGDEAGDLQDRMLAAVSEFEGIAILAGRRAWNAPPLAFRDTALGILPVDFAVPSPAARHTLWRASLQSHGIDASEDDLATVASRFRLMPAQISEAAAAARSLLERGDRDGPPLAGLMAGARAQCGHALAELTTRIEPVFRWEDIVLPDDALAQLREICQRVAARDRVMEDWGFESKLSGGKGINVLFVGPSGVGKTMAAEIMARELGLDLYKIDLSGVVSKYIGETEKNLDRIFSAAENANAILFFDEADALFGKRSEVRDSHDRYANVEIAYLLQKMEQYDGITILATNLRGNMDDSFTRRLAFTVHFPFPDENSRRRIWQQIWPRAVPLAPDVDRDFLANRFKLSGGNIRNVALAAAFLAAADGGTVTMAHLRHAVRREYQKMGKVLTDAEMEGV